MPFRNDDVTVTVGSDTYDLERGMVRGRGAVKRFDRDVSKMSLNLVKIGATAAVAVGGIAIAVAGLAGRAADAAKEIQNLSNLSGTGAEQFQRYAVASRTVGIEQDKLADIFKDVNDKFGEFLETGAGPLKDFFDQIAPQVGVTAEEFARLSGPEALQLYVTSLERAGVSQQRMTFYLEALASDATALLPLLRDNGAEFARLGDEAARSGRIMSEDAVRGGAELDDKLKELSDTLKTQMNQAILANSAEITWIAQNITDTWIPALISVAKYIADVTSVIAGMVEGIGIAISKIADFATSVGTLQDGAPDLIDSDSQLGRLRASGRRPIWEGSDTDYANEAFDVREGGSTRGSPLGLGQFAPEQVEKLQEARDESLRLQQEFRDEQERIEAEADEKRRAGAASNADELLKIEEQLQASKMSAIAGAFGDITSLTRSENEKLFKIGKASALAEAIVNGYSAATAAWDKGMKAGGPPVAAAFTAASLARTGSLIGSIQSQGFSSASGGGAGGGTSGGSGSSSAQAQERQVAEFRFIGGNVLDPQAIVDAINDAYDRGIEIRAVRV